MIFRVENLGPLHEAEVDLSKDLIVLTGPNNSGKTYLAWSVYGLFRTHPKGDFGFLHGLTEKLLASPKHELQPEDFAGYWGEVLSRTVEQFLTDIDRCFAAEVGYFEATKASLSVDDPTSQIELAERTGTLTAVNLADGSWWAFLGRINKSMPITFALLDGQESGQLAAFVDNLKAGDLKRRIGINVSNLQDEERSRAKDLALIALIDFMSKAAFRQCTLFPAERIAVNIFAKELALKRTELVDELLDVEAEGSNTEPLDIVKRRAGRYPLPIRDSLRVANDLVRISKQESPFTDLASELEMAVMGGKVGLSDLGEMVFTPDTATERHLGIHLTASIVKSLSSLVFYFRHMARKGDFLIIDEPELNLHPDNQRKIARILAKAVNRGFKIMISTHSDYIIRELNHLIMLSQPTEAAGALIKKLGYDPESTLKPERIGVYLFNEHRSQPVPVTETGFEVKTIEDEINKLNAVSQELYSTLFG